MDCDVRTHHVCLYFELRNVFEVRSIRAANVKDICNIFRRTRKIRLLRGNEESIETNPARNYYIVGLH